MPLQATLTLGWPRPDARAVTAQQILEQTFRPAQGETSIVVHCCEEMFRRRAGGFGTWKRFLKQLSDDSFQQIDIECRFDAFAFAFIRAAKSADLLFALKSPPFAEPQFATELDWFFEELEQLAEFEGKGIALPDSEHQARYLSAREILARPNCRDERRIVATLFVNGPSTADELARDLGISVSLASRTLAKLRKNHCAIQCDYDLERFSLDIDSLAVSYFLIQETLGFSIGQSLEQYVGSH